MPVWNYAKVPRVSLSPEENARLLCVYMRPWTLNPADATEQTPLLEDLSLVAAKEQTILTKASTLESQNSFTTGPAQKHAQDEKSTIAEDTEKTKRTDSAEKIHSKAQPRERRTKPVLKTTPMQRSGPTQQHGCNTLMAT